MYLIPREVLERAKISMSNEVLCNTISCTRKGRKRNRKKLTVEKILTSPKITNNEKQETSEESEQDDIREEGEEIGEEGEEIGDEGEEIGKGEEFTEEGEDDKEEIIREETIKDRHTSEEYNVIDRRHPVKKPDVISVSSDIKGCIYVPVSRSNAIQVMYVIYYIVCIHHIFHVDKSFGTPYIIRGICYNGCYSTTQCCYCVWGNRKWKDNTSTSVPL